MRDFSPDLGIFFAANGLDKPSFTMYNAQTLHIKV